MAGSLVQSAVLPTLHGSRSQFRRSARTRAISRVTMSKLQVRSPSLRFSGTRVPHTSFLGTGSILPGQAMRPVCKQTRSVALKAMYERFTEKAVKAMYEQFTEKAIKVVMLAQEEARQLGHNFVGTEQLLLGLIEEGTGIAAKVLKSMGINLKDARVEVEKIIGRGSGFVAVQIPFTPRSMQVLKLALEEARQLNHNYIGSEHLLLGLLQEGEGVAARVLETLGADPSNVRTQVIRMVGENPEAVGAGVGGGISGQKLPTLVEYGTNLTNIAEEKIATERAPERHETSRTNTDGNGIGIGKKGKKPSRVLLSTSGGRRY